MLPVAIDHVANVAGVVQLVGTGGAAGALLTTSDAVADLPVSKVSTNKLLVVLLNVPVVVVVTLTLMVHVPFAAIVPLEKEMEVAPAVGAKVGVPQLVVVAPGVVATFMLAGSGSVKLYPLITPGFGFVNVMVSDETPLTLPGFGLKLFAMVTLVGSTIFAKRAPVL